MCYNLLFVVLISLFIKLSSSTWRSCGSSSGSSVVCSGNVGCNAVVCFVLSTGLPFKAPQQAHQPAQCDHLRLSETTFCFGAVQIDIPPKNHCRRQKPTKKTTQIGENGAKQDHRSHRIPPLVQGRYYIYWGHLQMCCHSFWEVTIIRENLAACLRGSHLAIFKHIYLPPTSYGWRMLCGSMSRVC